MQHAVLHDARPAVAPYHLPRFSGTTALQAFDLFSQIFLRFTEFLLEPPEQLVVFSFGEREVIVGQLRVFLFQFAFDFVPAALEF